MKKIFTQSNNIKREYCATIIRVGEVNPIVGADKLASTLVNGFSVVIDKNSVKEGDIMFYCANETMLNETFLSVNNQYDMENRDKNANADFVNSLIAEGKRDEAKMNVGYFNKYGRVKMIRLRGIPSYGYLISVDSMINYCPAVAKVNLNELVGQDFDTIDGELFIKVYIPPVKVRESTSHRNERKRQKKVERFDRLIPGEFEFHYDTDQLNRDIAKLNPTDNITISVKEHGCVDANTLIETDQGIFTIKEIHDKKLQCKVKSYNVETQQIEYSEIEQYYLIPNDGDWLKITLENGQELIITTNNPVWLPELNCYRRADELKIDDIVLID